MSFATRTLGDGEGLIAEVKMSSAQHEAPRVPDGRSDTTQRDMKLVMLIPWAIAALLLLGLLAVASLK